MITRPDALAVEHRQADRLDAFAYGHRWTWSQQTDQWAEQLGQRLGEAADVLEGRFAVYLLATDPRQRRRGLATAVLGQLLAVSGPRAWLITRGWSTYRTMSVVGSATHGRGRASFHGRP